jgi:polar amino acid transport system substrate-binding protein
MIRNFSGVTLSSTANGFRVVPDLRCGTQATVRPGGRRKSRPSRRGNGDDLTGKRLASTRGATSDKLATEGAKGAQMVRFDDDATLITGIASGQVEFAATSPALIKAIRDSAPQRDIGVKFVMEGFPLGIGKAKLQEWINGWIQTNTGNGQLAAIHKKFHG